jgi:transcriptional regulator with XRE-family HTH domain
MYHYDKSIMKREESPTLKDLRTGRGLTQAHLATRLGIHQTALSRLEARADISVSMLKSYVEALGGKLEINAVFPDAAVSLSRIAEVQHLEELHALEWQQCCIHPMPPERAADRFLVKRVDDSLIELEKLSNGQVLEIPIRRVLEVLPATSSVPVRTIILRGSLKWSANEKLWRVSLD